MPLENPTVMTYSDLSVATYPYDDLKRREQIKETPMDCRYDIMMQDFYDYIKGEKENPFTYEHEYTVQEVLDEIVGGVKFYGKNID